MRYAIAMLALLLAGGCAGLDEDRCGNTPNVINASFEKEGGEKIEGSYCATCNGGLVKFTVQQEPLVTFQMSLDGTTGSWPLPNGYEAGVSCPSLYWELSDGQPGESGAEQNYTAGTCGIAAPDGVSGSVQVTAAPGSGRCTGTFQGRLHRHRFPDRNEWVNVSFAFNIEEAQ